MDFRLAMNPKGMPSGLKGPPSEGPFKARNQVVSNAYQRPVFIPSEVLFCVCVFIFHWCWPLGLSHGDICSERANPGKEKAGNPGQAFCWRQPRSPHFGCSCSTDSVSTNRESPRLRLQGVGEDLEILVHCPGHQHKMTTPGQLRMTDLRLGVGFTNWKQASQSAPGLLRLCFWNGLFCVGSFRILDTASPSSAAPHSQVRFTHSLT